MISIAVETAEIKRKPSNGATRAVFRARNEDGTPAAVFLCCVEPPDAFDQMMRESFVTICSVEDLAEYPVGVSAISEVDPADYEPNTYLFDAQANKIYVRSSDVSGSPKWTAYHPASGLRPNVHGHKLPFFRRSAIDIILPNREFVVESIGWIQHAVARLEKDLQDIEYLKTFNP